MNSEMKRKIVLIGLIETIVILLFITLYLMYRNNTYYDVVFADNGDIIERIKVKRNGTVKVPKSVKKDGYEVSKYLLGDKEYDFNSKVTKGIVIEVEWKKIKKETKPTTPDKPDTPTKKIYTVTFDTQGGTTIEKIEVEDGNKIPTPTNPTKNGYEFVEWQLNGTKYDFESEIKSDITLVAVWKETAKPNDPTPEPTPTPTPTPEPTPTPAPQPVVKNYTYSVTPVDAFSPAAYVSVYENGNLISVNGIYYVSDGVQLGDGGTVITVNKDDINDAGGSIKVLLPDGSTVIATKQ